MFLFHHLLAKLDFPRHKG